MIGFIADVHLANFKRFARPSRGFVAPVNTRAADTLRVLGSAMQECERLGVTDLFMLGDVFDTTHPEPQLIAELSAVLRAERCPSRIRVHLMAGNHDQCSDAVGDNALVALSGGDVLVYDRPRVVRSDDGSIAVSVVPYQPGRAVDYLPAVIGRLQQSELDYGARRVLALHLGLRCADTEPWLQNSHDSYPAADLAIMGYGLVAAGNWHGRQEVLPGVWQVGALVPTGFDNPGWSGYGTLLTYDGTSAEARELPGPRFVKAVGLDHLRLQLERASGPRDYPVYVSAKVDPGQRGDALEVAELFGFPTEHLELLTAEGVEAAARTAALAAVHSSPDGARAAISAFVSSMHLPDGVDRESVAALALDYFSGSAQG